MARCCRTNDFGASCDSENLICSGEREGVRGNRAKEERETLTLAGLRSETASRLLEISFDSLFFSRRPFPDFISKRFSKANIGRDCVDLLKLLRAQYIAKFRESLLIKCLRAGLRRRHNVSEFIHEMIITRTHWHIYRATEGCPAIGLRH